MAENLTCPDCKRTMTDDQDPCGWCDDMDYDRVQDMAAESMTDYSNHHLLAEDHL